MTTQTTSNSIHLREHVLDSPRVSNTLDTAFLSAAAFSLALSVVLWFALDQSHGIFVGLWVPSIIGLWTGLKVTALYRALSREQESPGE